MTKLVKRKKQKQSDENNNRSIASQISKSLTIVLLPSLIILIMIACFLSARSISKLNKELLKDEADFAVSSADEFFSSKVAAASMFAENSDFQGFFTMITKKEDINNYPKKNLLVKNLASTLQRMGDENVEEVWLADPESDSYLLSNGEVTDAGLDNIPWVTAVRENKKTVISEPYFDEVSKKQVISIVSPVFSKDSDEIIGFFGFDVFLENLSKILSEIKIGEKGYLELLSSSSEYIYSDDNDLIGKKVTEIDISDKYKKNVQDKYTGIMDYRYDGVSYTSMFKLSETTGWLAITTLPMSEVNATRNQLIFVLIIISILILVILLRVTTNIIQNIMKPLAEISSNMKEFAQGNLDVDIQVKSNDEIGSLADNIRSSIGILKDIIQNISGTLAEISGGNLDLTITGNYVGDFLPIREALTSIVQSLNETLRKINFSSDQVASGAEQVSSASQALSEGATEQASTVQELAATINEISEKVTQNATNAIGATNKVNTVGKEVLESNQQMEEMLVAMQEISECSKQIENIIKTIEDIASQTNLLSLNAAIEAARAGEAGKGFAVVADEIRDLASKSAEASRNTSDLIQNSLDSVKNGIQIANDMAAFLQNVVKGVEDVEETIDDISSSSKQQAYALQQITMGVDQISGVVQNNSATAEESAAASEELTSQATVLRGQVERFQLKQ